jgi:TonB family protein
MCCAQQPAAPDPVYSPGNGISHPRPIYNPEPDLSKEPKRDKFNGGPLLVKVIIRTDGKIHEAEVLKSLGDAELDAKAIEVMRTWIFGPCLKDQKPVSCKITAEVNINIH